MATFYLDYINGSDANNGSTWALAWKTLTLRATLARIAPADVIRIAKSPDTTSLGITALWTNLSKTVTLASSLNLTVELCETAWTASANVTATASTTRKEGANSASLAIAAGFTTGKVAYKALAGATDYSGYQQLSFFVQNSAAIATGAIFRVCLCSDTIGDTIVDSFYIKAIPSTGQWLAVTVDKGSALGASIQSVALYADSDPGTITFLLDQQRAASATVGRGYTGTTETVTTYKRETIKTDMVTASGTIVQEVMDSGTSGSPITFSGGWNTATTTQDGETVFDGQNGFGNGLRINGKLFITLERVCCTNYDIGLGLNSGGTSGSNYIVTATNLNNNTTDGIRISYLANSTVNITNMLANGTQGAQFYVCAGGYNSDLTLTNMNSNGTAGMRLAYSVMNKINAVSIKNNGSYGVITEADDSENYIKGATFASNGSYGIYKVYGGNLFLKDCLISDTTEVNSVNAYHNSRVFSHNHDQTTGNYRIFTDGGQINSETSHKP